MNPGLEEKIANCLFPIFLHGPKGVGKSCLAGLICPMALWADAACAIMAISLGRTEPQPLLGRAGAARWLSADMLYALSIANELILDDVGTRTPTEAAQDTLLEIVKLRERKPTVYTSNLSPGELARVYDDRIVDRIACGTVIEMTGKSLRTGV